MPSGGGPGLQSRAGGSRTVPGGFDSHPFRQKIVHGRYASVNGKAPGKNRIKINQGSTRLRISIPLAPSESSRLHLTALLVIWVLGAAFAAGALILGEPVLGPMIVHFLWWGAGLPVIWAYLRFARGREVITLTDGKLTIARKPLGYRSRYHTPRIKRLRVDTKGLRLGGRRHRRNPLRWRGERGLLLFDYGLKPVRFGVAIDAAQAREILQAIKASGFIGPDHVEE